MANKDNFKTNIQEISSELKKFSVSRVFDDMQNPLLEVEIPPIWYTRNEKINIELNLYSLADNSLVYSDIIRDAQEQDAIEIQTYQYPDLSLRKLLFIDFSKVPNIFIPPGRFSVTLNFFIDELGSRDERLLSIKRISPSRKEVEFTFPADKKEEVENFISYRIPKEIVIGILQQLCNQPNSKSLQIPVLNNTIDSAAINANLPVDIVAEINKANFDENQNDTTKGLSVYSVAQNILNIVYPRMLQTINTQIQNGTTVFYSQDLLDLMRDTIGVVYEEERKKIYRFELI